MVCHSREDTASVPPELTLLLASYQRDNQSHPLIPILLEGDVTFQSSRSDLCRNSKLLLMNVFIYCLTEEKTMTFTIDKNKTTKHTVQIRTVVMLMNLIILLLSESEKERNNEQRLSTKNIIKVNVWITKFRDMQKL